MGLVRSKNDAIVSSLGCDLSQSCPGVVLIVESFLQEFLDSYFLERFCGFCLGYYEAQIKSKSQIIEKLKLDQRISVDWKSSRNPFFILI